MTTQDVENIIYTGELRRPSTTKGSVMGSDSNGTFEIVSPTTNSEVLTADSSESGGIKWGGGTENSGFAFVNMLINYPDPVGTVFYYLADSGTTPPPLVLPASKALFLGISPTAGGYLTTPAKVDGGTLDFRLGYFDSLDQPTTGNFNVYNGSDDLQIQGTSINTDSTNYSTFFTALNITVTSGQQVVMRITDNFSEGSGAPTDYNSINSFIMFQGT